MDPVVVDKEARVENVPEPLVELYGPDGKLTRAGMEWTIRNNGSVFYGRTIINKLEDLPTEAQLAKGDQVKAAAAAANLQRQIDALQSQMKDLTNSPATEDTHRGDLPVVSMSPSEPGGGIVLGKPGEGDTAGLDGDAGSPDTPAGEKAAEEQAAALKRQQEAAEENAKAAREAAKAAKAAAQGGDK